MGVGGSTAIFEKNSFIEQFVGGLPISAPVTEEFWAKLLDFRLSVKDTTSKEIEDAVKVLCSQLATNNLRTLNFSLLLLELISLLNQFPVQIESTHSTISKTLHAIFLVRVFSKFLIETCPTEIVYSHFQMRKQTKAVSKSDNQISQQLNPSLPETKEGKQEIVSSNLQSPILQPIASSSIQISTDDDEEELPDLLLKSLLDFLIEKQVNSSTYEIHVEILNTLLILLSTQLFSSPDGAIDLFIDSLLNETFESRSGPLVEVLLSHFISQVFSFYFYVIRKPPKPVQSQSLFRIFGSISNAASFVIYLPWNIASYFFSSAYQIQPSNTSGASPLSEKSLLVLLILIHRGDMDNFFRKNLFSMQDTDFINDQKGRNSLIKLPIKFLYERITKNLHDDKITLLFYFLIHGNPLFRSFVLSKTDLDTMVLPMLQVLYKASDHKPQHIYMTLITMLILSHDIPFNKNIQTLIIPSVSWFKESTLHHISLGSLTVVVLVKTVQENLSKLRDIYLHSNGLATLANMAPHIIDMHPYAANRLVKLLDMLSKKYLRIANYIQSSKKETKTKEETVVVVDTPATKVEDKENIREEKPQQEAPLTDFHPVVYESQELTAYSDFLHMVLKIVNSIISQQLSHNVHFIYALVYQEDIFKPLQSHPRISGLVNNIEKVIDYFRISLEKEQSESWSIDKIHEAIKRYSLSWKYDTLKKFVHLQFKYEEEEDAEDFFTPYVWAIVVNCSGFYWNPENIRLFSSNTST